MKHNTITAYVFSRRTYRSIGRAILKPWLTRPDLLKDAIDTAMYADRSGTHSHGLAKLRSLCEHVIKINTKAEPRRVNEKSASVVWDGDDQIGTTTSRLAVDDLVARVEACGIGIASVNNGTHFLMPYHAIKAAQDHQIIIQVIATAARSEVTALGAKRPSLGTNPITWIIPRGPGKDPLIADCATSAMSFGKLSSMKMSGQKLPPGCAVDAQGNETTDPHQAASPLPAGRLGNGLSQVVEGLAALVGGSKPALRGKHGQGPKGEKHNCVFIYIGIHPSALNGHQFACGRTQRQNLNVVLDSIISDGGGTARLAGERRAKWLKLSQQYRGPILPAAQAEKLIELAQQAGLRIKLSDLTEIELSASLMQ